MTNETHLCEHRKRCSLWPLSSSCSEKNLLFCPCAASSGYSQPPVVSKRRRNSEEIQNVLVFGGRKLTMNINKSSKFRCSNSHLCNRCCFQSKTSPHLIIHWDKLQQLLIFLQQILTHLFTGLAGEGLLHSGLLHLNILILVEPFFWVPLYFGLWVGWDPVKV